MSADTIREFIRRLGHPVAIRCQAPVPGVMTDSIMLWPEQLKGRPEVTAEQLAPHFDKIYVNLNALRSEFHAKQPPGTSIRRHMIDRLTRLLIDVDAHDVPKDEAHRQMLAIRAELGEPLIASHSGNGFGLIYPIDLPVEDHPRVTAFLKQLKERYPCVDAGVGTPERWTRLIGTMNRDKHTDQRIMTCLL